MLPVNREKFLDGEGSQLMNLMLKQRKQSREMALKAIPDPNTLEKHEEMLRSPRMIMRTAIPCHVTDNFMKYHTFRF
ncbi:hypothetical protein KIN20_014519 [Parelaphostrongylus tenuis]|uniref:Beta-catenin-like protein 1 N-terminal domain-containing protein n=1 Tax=Parelaphostrongylus tenuis TaxID=148309 RepID=A0AAD5QPH1_PARTN|nr:hypothetical protein KIN20_014519 [Parelaphostrongylus tenuis]